MVEKYIKRPVEIEAICWDGENTEAVESFCIDCYANKELGILMVNAIDGPLRASVGDYIVKTAAGFFYACNEKLFNKNYVKANNYDKGV